MQLYNETVEEIEKIRTNNRRITINDIPLELLLDILLQASTQEREIYMIDRVLELTLVCTKWTDLVLNTARFWVRTELLGLEDAEAKLALSLQLSRDLPLTLVYGSDLGFVRALSYLLSPHAHRVESIIREGNGDPQEATEEEKLLERLVIPGNLIEVSNRPRRNVPEESDLWISHILGPSINLLNLGDKLRRISLGVWSAQALVALIPLKNLMSVSIYIEGTQLARDEEELARKLGSIDSLPWLEVALYGLSLSLMTRLFHLLNGALVKLSILISSKHLGHVMKAMERMERLRELDIGLYNYETHSESIAIVDTDYKSLSLTSLTLSLSWDHIEISDLIASFCRHNPPLKRLEVHGQSEIPRWESDFRSLKHLRHLALVGADSPVTEVPDIETFTIGAPTGKFQYWHSASVLHLRCTITVLDDQPFALDSCSWPKVEALTIEEKYFQPDAQLDVRLNLANLRRCTLHLAHDFGICHALAMYPQNVPRLEEIHFKEPPEWDILFILIERRLALSVEGITPISLLRFRCAPPEEIRVPLVSLLRGRIIRRPSNYELSIQGNILLVLGRHFDRMRLCGYIGRSLREETDDNTEEVDLSGLPPYPSTAQGVLETWHERKAGLENMMAQHSYSGALCRTQLATLTKYTEIPSEDEETDLVPGQTTF